jgi:hypothetical protein
MANTKSEVDEKRGKALRRMLNTPHKKHEPLKPRAKPRKSAKNAKKA